MTDQQKVTKRLTLDISPEEHRRLKIAAARSGMSMRELILQLLWKEVLAEAA